MSAALPTEVAARLGRLAIELPSWGFADTGTRFGKFLQDAAALTIEDKLDDAAEVHRLTGACPSVAIHVQWDMPAGGAPELAALARARGLRIGSVNPTLFQDQCYRFGSVANEDPAIRRRAIDHMLASVEVGRTVGSGVLALWFADGTNYPGQGSVARRKRWFAEALREVHAAMPASMSMLVEYKPFEPAFYHTDIADWGMAYVLAKSAGEHARVLARGLREHVRHAPVGDVGVVERRLERLVLDEHRHRRGHRGVHLAQRLGEPALAPRDAPLSRVVGAVGEPEREHARSDRPPDLDRREHVVDRPPPDRRILVRDRPEPVALVLEERRIDRADPQPARPREGRELRRPARGHVPLHVDRHARARARQAMHLGRVVELVLDGERRGVLQELAEPGAGVGEAPRGKLDREAPEAGGDLCRKRGAHPLSVRNFAHPCPLR